MKIELLIKKDAPLSEQAREVLEDLRGELGFELTVVDAQADSFLYLRHRYDLPVIKLDGRILSQRTAERDEIERRIRHARRMKESQGMADRLAAGDSGRPVVKVSMADLGAAAPRATPLPHRPSTTPAAGERKVVKVSLASVAGQALPRSEEAPARPEKEEKVTEKLPALSLPADGGLAFAVDAFPARGLIRRLEARPGIEEVRADAIAGVVGLRGDPAAIREAADEFGGRSTPTGAERALGLAALAAGLGLGAWFAGPGALGALLGGLAALLPLALPEGRRLLRDHPLLGAHPLYAGAAFLLVSSQEGLSPALAAGPALAHLVALSFLLSIRRRTRELLGPAEVEGPEAGRLTVEAGREFPTDGRLLAPCLVDERMLGGDEEAERLEGEPVFAGAVAIEEAEILVDAGPSRRSRGQARSLRALAETTEGLPAHLPLAAPLAAIALAAIAGGLVGPSAGASILGGFPVLALAAFLPLGRATALLRAFRDGVAVATWRAIARAGAVRTVVFGKGALLERGHPKILGTRGRNLEARHLLSLAAAAERGVDHPIAHAIVAHAEELEAERLEAASAPRLDAEGVTAEVGGATIRVGSAAFLGRSGIDASPFQTLAQEMGQRGSTPVLVARDKEAVGIVEVGTPPSDGARQAIASLELRGVDLVLATADSGLRARWLAQALGLDPAQAFGDLGAETEDRLLRSQERPVLLAAGPRHLSRTDEADLTVGARGPTDDLPAFLLRPDPRGVAALVRTGRIGRRALLLGLGALGLSIALLVGLGMSGLLAPSGALALSLGATVVSMGAAVAAGVSLR